MRLRIILPRVKPEAITTSRRSKSGLAPIAKSVDAQVLVTDDVDGFKTVADEVGL